MERNANDRFYPSGLNSHFLGGYTHFNAYQLEMESIIRQARVDLHGDNAEHIVAVNSPQEHRPLQPRRGIILVHGLFESPYSMSSLFDSLCNEDTWVQNILLPGHGTRPGDLLDVTLEDWIKMLEFSLHCMHHIVDEISVIGMSTGASLALFSALNGAPIDKIVLFAPAIEIINPFASYSFLHQTISWAWHRAKWFSKAPERDYAKYQSICFNSVYQVARLTHRIQNMSHRCPCPMMMIITDDDEVVSTSANIDYFHEQTHPQKRLVLYSHERQPQTTEQISIVFSRDLKHKILDYSHPCLAVSPDHPHYGRAGDFQDDVHYHTWWGKNLPHRHDPEVYYGALKSVNLNNHHLHRIRYNPHFPELMVEIRQFLASSD